MWKKYREKQKIKKLELKEKRKKMGFFREYIELIAETLIYVFFVMTFLIQSFVIPTGSMEKNLLVGDHLLVDKVSYSRSLSPIDRLVFPQKKIKRGMIVTFKAPADIEKEYVKRVIALPGEKIKIIGKKVYINGKLLDEPYTYFRDPNILKNERDYMNEYLVTENSYFCMGDNRDNSYDSRYWGTVPADFIIGKPWRVYWSFSSTSDEYLTPGFLHKMKDLFKTVVNFFSKTRWERTGMKIK